jgi:Xaa-Pro aminopeptidase
VLAQALVGAKAVLLPVSSPSRTPPEAFAERRRQLSELLGKAALSSAVIASGLPQPRNFAHNLYPFRASSHFLYLVGEPLEGCVLDIGPEHERLYVDPPDAATALWTGPQPTLNALADRLALEVRPLEEFRPRREAACLAPVDALTTLWLSDILDRPLEPAHGEPQSTADALLADAMIELRLRHDAAAVEQLRGAAGATLLAHLAGMAATPTCKHEFEVRAVMEAAILRQGMTLAYQPIVTSHGEVLHNERHTNPLSEHDLLLADVGAETREGWACDVTRTWPVRASFSSTQRELYEVVLAAQAAALNEVRPLVRFTKVHHAALASIADGLAQLGILRGSADELVQRGAAAIFFPHGVGHLLGLDVHDMEDLGDRAGYAPGRQRSAEPGTRYLRLDRDLDPGMLVTIEPGFYQIPTLLDEARLEHSLRGLIDFERLSDFRDVRGIRIEDDVLVTEKGFEVLTAGVPKSIEDVEAACLGAYHSF